MTSVVVTCKAILTALVLTITCPTASLAWPPHGGPGPVACSGDGSSGAPAVAPAFPTLLNGYAFAPACKYPDVGYGVGANSSLTLVDTWLLSPPAGVTYNGSTHVVFTNGNNITISGVDFSPDGGWLVVASTGNNVTITNDKFVTGANGQDFIQIGTGVTNATITNNTFNSNNASDGASFGANLYLQGSGTMTLEYNKFENGWCQFISLTPGSSQTDVIDFNAFENNGYDQGGCHYEWLKVNGNFPITLTANHNTSIQNTAGYVTEGYFASDGFFTPTLLNPTFNDNLIFASAANSMLYVFLGDLGETKGTYSASNNFVLPTGIGFGMYSVPVNTQAVFTGSIAGTTLTVTAMTSGTISPNGQYLTGAGAPLNANPSIVRVTSQLSGTTGGAGTYQLNTPITIGSETLTEYSGPYGLSPGLFVHTGNINISTGAAE